MESKYYLLVYHMDNGTVHCLRSKEETPRDIALAELKSQLLYGKRNGDNIINERGLLGEEILILANRICYVETQDCKYDERIEIIRDEAFQETLQGEPIKFRGDTAPCGKKTSCEVE